MPVIKTGAAETAVPAARISAVDSSKAILFIGLFLSFRAGVG
jgi:hypothetical protein